MLRGQISTLARAHETQQIDRSILGCNVLGMCVVNSAFYPNRGCPEGAGSHQAPAKFGLDFPVFVVVLCSRKAAERGATKSLGGVGGGSATFKQRPCPDCSTFCFCGIWCLCHGLCKGGGCNRFFNCVVEGRGGCVFVALV